MYAMGNRPANYAFGTDGKIRTADGTSDICSNAKGLGKKQSAAPPGHAARIPPVPLHHALENVFLNNDQDLWGDFILNLPISTTCVMSSWAHDT